MKHTIIEEAKPKFKPFNLEVTVENENDLIELYHRFNLSSFSMGNYLKEHKYQEFYSDSFDIWASINKKIKEYNIKL